MTKKVVVGRCMGPSKFSDKIPVGICKLCKRILFPKEVILEDKYPFRIICGKHKIPLTLNGMVVKRKIDVKLI